MVVNAIAFGTIIMAIRSAAFAAAIQLRLSNRVETLDAFQAGVTSATRSDGDTIVRVDGTKRIGA